MPPSNRMEGLRVESRVAYFRHSGGSRNLGGSKRRPTWMLACVSMTFTGAKTALRFLEWLSAHARRKAHSPGLDGEKDTDERMQTSKSTTTLSERRRSTKNLALDTLPVVRNKTVFTRRAHLRCFSFIEQSDGGL
jgi:hypothetical protein